MIQAAFLHWQARAKENGRTLLAPAVPADSQFITAAYAAALCASRLVSSSPRGPASTTTLCAVMNLSGDDLASKCGLKLPLNHAAQRTRAVNRIVAMFGEVVARLVGQLELRFSAPRRPAGAAARKLNIHDLPM